MTLQDLATLLRDYSTGAITLEGVQGALAPVVGADPLHVEATDSTPWDRSHHDARLFWRLVYLFDSEDEGSDGSRRLAGRIVEALGRTGSAEATFELLPMLLDQERFCAIVDRHRHGVISRTGFLSVLAESGYPAHVKLWLEHAPATTLGALCDALVAGSYDRVSTALERAPSSDGTL